MSETRDFLRHTVATLAYRAAKAIRGAPDSFAEFRCSESTRSAGAILAHIGDLLDWATTMTQGNERWQGSAPLPWSREVARVEAALEMFDAYLRSDQPLLVPAERLFQGPVADALTHVGQLAILRRLAGTPIRGENYFRAEIITGRVGFDQAPARREFGG